jgi:hypothetical protein
VWSVIAKASDGHFGECENWTAVEKFFELSPSAAGTDGFGQLANFAS